jgi:hypothetical protein
MATSLSLENDSSLAQGYLKVNGSTAATLTTSGITGNLTGNVTGNAATATKLSTTTGSAPAYACRAWVNFDGTRDTTGAVSTANTNRFIRSSGNVTSVLRNGTGDYTVTFTTAMSDANYAITLGGQVDFGSSGNPWFFGLRATNNVINTKTTSQCRFFCANDNFVGVDGVDLSVTIFGN